MFESMSEKYRAQAQDLDVTVWVGKSGIEAVRDELDDQLANRELVKVKFLRSARGGTSTDELAADLAEMVDAELIETRGNTGVYHR
ncbi:RNA-binding protein YhbY [Halodesulfurarchaeum formicicum]|uniref:RNA-binding protein YhbY n=2 Tax=Halodesulfurarchaeum formicicum TaxID=1873524 RepID=A0A1D8S4U4_9EURY|nr:RNA-binding protein YhbY [Halodesulfurarchaeum formicicum]APE95679.1 RNA-binding protein YhbY [Halodesulfurarchaeum formicicum]